MDLVIVEDNAGFRPEVTVGDRVFTTLSFRTREAALLAGKRIMERLATSLRIEVENV